ncbi:hypothetical protein ACOSQ3_009473 [Xanthoceras sorbifolium]
MYSKAKAKRTSELVKWRVELNPFQFPRHARSHLSTPHSLSLCAFWFVSLAPHPRSCRRSSRLRSSIRRSSHRRSSISTPPVAKRCSTSRRCSPNTTGLQYGL